MKFLIITMGPGETSQGAAFGRYVIQKGHSVSFRILRPENRTFFRGLPVTVKSTRDGMEAAKDITKGGFDVVVFCNSKIFKSQDIHKIEPSPRPFCCSIDSNWLFGKDVEYPWIGWLDNYYINLPVKVFKLGLSENGGNFNIADNVKSRLVDVGMIPSYKPLDKSESQKIRNKIGVKQNQNLLFSYIGSSITYKDQFQKKYIETMKVLQNKYHDKIKIMSVGKELHIPQTISTLQNVSSEWFYRYLASSDIVFQHQGLGTLEQAISARIPVIANVIRPEKGEKVNAHAWEVGPFEKAGLCKMHYYDDPVQNVVESVEKLIFNQNIRQKMIDSQKKHYSMGEKTMLENIEASVKGRKQEE